MRVRRTVLPCSTQLRHLSYTPNDNTRTVYMQDQGLPMLFKLIILFTLTPLLELALLIEFGKQVGVYVTLALVTATGLLGAILAKNQVSFRPMPCSMPSSY